MGIYGIRLKDQYAYLRQISIQAHPAGEEVKMATDKFEHATFYLTKGQVDDIKRLARDQQISRSALVRMIIRAYLTRKEEPKE